MKPASSRPFHPWRGPACPEFLAGRMRGASCAHDIPTELTVAVLAFTASLAAQQPDAQPWKGKNLQYFPADVTREALV